MAMSQHSGKELVRPRLSTAQRPTAAYAKVKAAYKAAYLEQTR
jgi:hypothetical protein